MYYRLVHGFMVTGLFASHYNTKGNGTFTDVIVIRQTQYMCSAFNRAGPHGYKLANRDPSQDSSIDSILAWYRGGPGFNSQQGQEFFSENK